MKLYEQLAKTGINAFLELHPTLIAFKKEAKKLYKEKKAENVTLMQCMDLVAKNHHYNNWHQIISIIKRNYVPGKTLNDLYKPTIITKNELENNEYLLLGQDKTTQHYHYLSGSAQRTHILIVGEDIYQSYDIWISKQAISKNNGLIFLDGDSHYQTTNAIIAHAKKNQREKEVHIINFNNAKENKEYQSLLYLNFNDICKYFLEILSPYIMGDYKVKNSLLTQTELFSYFSLYTYFFTWSCENKNTYTNTEDVINSICYKNFIEISKREDIPENMKKTMKEYLINIDNHESFKGISFQEKVIIHDKLTETILTPYKKMFEKYKNQFSNNMENLSLYKMFKKDNKDIIIFQFPNFINSAKEDWAIAIFIDQIYKNIYGKYFQETMDKLRERNEIIETWEDRNKNIKNIIFRNYPVSHNNIASQARGYGHSLIYSYSNISIMNRLVKNFNSEILANTNTKIISIYDNDPNVKNFIKMNMQDVSQLMESGDNMSKIEDNAMLVFNKDIYNKNNMYQMTYKHIALK